MVTLLPIFIMNIPFINLLTFRDQLAANGITLVVVSKSQPPSRILELYQLGQRIFAENYVQELLDKLPLLPSDIQWHFIGHLQRNKVRQIASFISLIQSVDSLKLLHEINRQACLFQREIKVLLQVHIAKEETKYGLDPNSVLSLVGYPLNNLLPYVPVAGLMGMATQTQDISLVGSEFSKLRNLFIQLKENSMKDDQEFKFLSMGMSGDYETAIKAGSNMVRIGSLIFGKRD